MNIKERLKAFDEELYLMGFQIQEKLKMYIVGGGALYLLHKIRRVTYDIDAFFPNNRYAEIHDVMQKYDINTRVNVYRENFAHDFEKRVSKLDIETKMVDFYTLSIEDLVISKIAAGRPKDIKDICSNEIVQSIDWEVLEMIKQDIIENMLSPRAVNEFVGMYNDFRKEYQK